ncbi:MAG: DUF4296 domain-containing protein [Tannerella sp.]|jgi:hypothetical protein|nr:DUF4296 domain-containing protein [Tannerella sp.]
MAASCSRVPEHIISEKKMRATLYDMQIAEAIVETDYESYRTSDERQVVYDAVFAKHHITQAEYDSSLVWYGENMDLYMRIYRLVLKDINENIASLGDIKPNPLSGDVSAKDSIDVWVYNRSFTFRPERVFNALTFDIKPQKPYSSGSSYVFGLSVWGIFPNLKHKPRIRINAVHADTVISVNRDITGDGYYETVVRTIATKQVERVYGHVIMNDANASYHRIYMDDIRLMKYNYGSKALTAPQTDSLPSQPETDLLLEIQAK